MTPSVLARQLDQGVRNFVGATFPIASPYFEGMVDGFLDKPGNVFKGPYYQLGLPYKHGEREIIPFETIRIEGFRPWSHQDCAWKRLGDEVPKSTLVATGTGSGKTECFLFPVLDYCAKNRGKGIKAIILYPMNALADDQARRLAKLIHEQAGLEGLRAGVYTGSASETRVKTMGKDELITDRDTMRDYPPDILLTNYKMLDLLLLRAKDRKLWNIPALKFLIVDELHSFDGAQGTDLACLIRRLRERLNRTDRNSLACVGTSATLGTGEEARTALLEFAQKVFHAEFDTESLVEEDRETEREFLADSWVSRIGLPGPENAEILKPFPEETFSTESTGQNAHYLTRQMSLWFPDIEWSESEEDRLILGSELKTHGVFQNILRYTEGRARSGEELVAHIRKTWAPARSWEEDHLNLCIDSLFALISQARRLDGTRTVPFLTVRTQFWMREMRRLVAGIIVPDPNTRTIVPLKLSDEITSNDKRTWLPAVHCRECNTVGWLTREAPGVAPVVKDLRSIYNGYFGGATDTIVLYPIELDNDLPANSLRQELCPDCGCLSRQNSTECEHCHKKSLLPVWKSQLINANGKFDSSCPRCGSAGDLSIMGSKAASLLAALVGQTFSSPFNSDKKLLAFSDSVQDAAHRAGFLTARAWTFSFRTAICQVIQNLDDSCTLKDLSTNFLSYWKEKLGNEENFIGTFLPPDLEWFEEYENLVKENKLTTGSGIVSSLSKRLSWEIASECTFRSRIGRTLERSGTAIATVDPNRLMIAAEHLAQNAANHQERFRQTNKEDQNWARFLWGIIFRFKNLGAVNETSIQSLFNFGSTFPFNRSLPHMPNFPKRAPHIVTNGPAKKVYESLYATDKRSSWFETWLAVCKKDLLTEFLLEGSTAEDTELIALAIAALTKQDILSEIDLSENKMGWLLTLSALRIYTGVAHLRCSACGSALESATADLKITEGMRCFRFGCRGIYKKDSKAASDYYRNFYQRGEVIRINGREHTGLLGGKERKKLEESFIAGEHSWDPNLLSATPTLEMGINIGDLSTVFLCSIPPAVSNFLQRIGRAGRLNGNANIVTMANAVPHDQYFFQSPREMIEGAVDAPAIYDRAVAVLERHLTAFALARWTRDMPSHIDPVPKNVGDLIAAKNSQNTEVFPLAFITAMEKNRESWLTEFFIVFDHLPENGDEQQYLRAWLSSDTQEERTITRALGECLDTISVTIESMRARRRTLMRQAKETLELGTLTDEQKKEYEELNREAAGLNSGINQINKTETWQFLCDEGILPNYAFPETGVKLKATFYRKNRPEKKGPFAYSHVELVRSASSALREFAPENEFFGNGHRMKINRVDLKASSLEVWRFCPDCSHAVCNTHSHFILTDCPICHSPGWADIGQVHTLLRFRQVYSFSSYRESLISDSQEDREPMFYNTKLLVDFDPADPDNRYFGLKDAQYPVAIEFFRRAVFREVNFGKVDASQQGFSVAGVLDSKAGFPLCTLCGTFDPKNHAPECPNRKKTDDDITTKEVIHLYHEFKSEAIRLLIPVNEFPLENEIALESAQAGIFLGLKKHFGGKADHLKITQEQSKTSGGASLHYLIIYDSIPGGSGYLKDFFTEAKTHGTTHFFSILEKALQVLHDCSCRLSPDKDGCYRCVLSHKVSRKMKNVSRTMAIKILERILTEREQLVCLDEQAAARVDPLYDSKLEELFVGILQSPERWPVAVSVKPEMYHDKTGHYVQIGNKGYHLEQQVLISIREPLSATTRADFVFHPTASGEKPIIVYTDGFRFHKDSVAEDLHIRLALSLSGQYRVFSFSWDDVASIAENRPSELDRSGNPWLGHTIKNETAKMLQQFNLDRNSWDGCTDETGLIAFISMLSMNEKERERLWLDKALFSALSHILSTQPSPESIESLSERTGILFKPQSRFIEKELTPETGHKLSFVFEPPENEQAPNTPGWLVFNDTVEFQRSEWNSLLELINFYQILPQFAFATKSRAVATDWMSSAFISNKTESSIDDNNWTALEDFILVSWKPLVRYISELSLPIPEVGYEEIDSSGAVIFSAELAWPQEHFAILAHPRTETDPPTDWTLVHWSPDQPYPDINFGGTK